MKFRNCLERKRSANNIIFLLMKNLMVIVQGNSHPDHSLKPLILGDPMNHKNRMKRKSEKLLEKCSYLREMQLKAQQKKKFQKKYVF